MNQPKNRGPAANRHYTPLPLLLVLGLGAGLPALTQADEISLTIPFDADNCPTTPDGVSETEWTVNLSKNKNDTLKWTAMDTSVIPNQVYKGGYSIYFDPFKRGPKLEDDNKDGIIESGHLHDDVPLASFKYTIVGAECTDRPLDPRIRIQLD